MLIDKLYTVKSYDAQSAELRLCAGNVVYQAHFPGMPITPGACLVQMAAEVASLCTAQSLQLVGIRNAKFIRIVSPTSTPDILFKMEKTSENTDGTLLVHCTFATHEQTLTKLSVCLQKQ